MKPDVIVRATVNSHAISNISACPCIAHVTVGQHKVPPEPSRSLLSERLKRRLAAAHGGFDDDEPLPRRSPKAPRSSERARSPLVKRHDAPPRPAACGRLDFERAPPAADPATDAAAADLYVSTFVKGIIEASINNLAAGAVAAA